MNKELKSLISKTGIFEKHFIGPGEENSAPEDNIIKQDGYTYVIEDKGMTDEEVKIALLTKQTINTQTIKNTVVFGLVISIISVIISFIAIVS